MTRALVGEQTGATVTGGIAADDGAPDGLAGRGRDGPVVVLTYAHSGAELLGELLSASPSLACTSGTGVLPLCHAALATWRAVEGRDAGPSALAVRSVRALAAMMVTVIQVGSGASRWCETAVAAPEVAETFLQVFPSAAFVCLHRGLPGVIAEGLRAYPWGLGGSPFWPFAGPHPGNSVATIAAYWTACTEPLLDFEDRHPERSVRVRYEDLAGGTDQVAGAVYEFLGLDACVLSAPRAPRAAPAGKRADPEPAAQLSRLAGGLRAKIGELHGRLAYPALLEATGAVAGDPGKVIPGGRADTGMH